MKYKIAIIITILLASFARMQAGGMTLYDADISQYPVIRASFFAFDDSRNIINNLKPGQFTINDDGNTVNAVDIEYPAQDPFAKKSITICFDLGCGNNDGLFDLAKYAANDLLAAADDNTEYALSSFDQYSYLNQEFTQDKDLIAEHINGLVYTGTTNYTAGIASVPIGAIRVAQLGQYEKSIVVITGGRGPASVETIIAFAKASNVSIYFLSIGGELEEYLKPICTKTGGRWFDNLMNEKDIEVAVSSVNKLTSNYEPAIISWDGLNNCTSLHTPYFQGPSPDLNASVTYTVPDTLKPWLAIRPEYVEFSATLPGSTKTEEVTLFARNDDLYINAFILHEPSLSIISGDVEDNELFIARGDSHKIVIEFAPLDSALIFDSLNIRSNACAGDKLLITGGFPNTPPKERNLTLVNPECGSTVVVGDTTRIEWSGLLPNDVIQLEYTTDHGENWGVLAKDIDGLHYDWFVEELPTDGLRIRAIQLWPNNVGQTMDFPHTTSVNASNFNWNGDLVVTASKDNIVRLWNSNNGKIIHEYSGHTQDVRWVNFDPQDRYIVSSSKDSTAIVWDINSGEMTKRITFHNSYVTSANFSPDGNYLLTTSKDDQFACIWEVGTWDLVRTIKSENSQLFFGQFSPDGKHIITCGSSNMIELWETDTGNLVRQYLIYDRNQTKPSITVTNLSFHPNGEMFATSDWRGQIIIWNIEYDEDIVDIKQAVKVLTHSEDGALANCVSFDYSGKYMLSTAGETARMWDTETWEFITLEEHEDAVQTATFNFDGSRILTSSWDHTAKIWNLEKRDLQSDTTKCFLDIAGANLQLNDIVFEKVIKGEFLDKEISDFIVNLCDFPYKIYSIEISGPQEDDFKFVTDVCDSMPFILGELESKPATIRFVPGDYGERNATITVKYPGGQTSCQIYGNGYNPGLVAENEFIDFGSVEMEDYLDSTISIVVRNKDVVDIDIEDVQMFGPNRENFFVIDGGEQGTLKPGEGRKMTLRYVPTELAFKNAQLIFTHTGLGKKCQVTLIGEGVPAIIDTATIYIEEISGNPGDIVELPIKIKNVDSDGFSTRFTGFQGELRFNYSLLDPISNILSSRMDGDQRIIVFDIPREPGPDSILTTLKFKVALGNDTLTALNFSAVPVGGGKIILHQETADFHMTGACKQGGTRLFEAGGVFALAQTQPNPVTNSAEISFEVVSRSQWTRLYVADMSGRTVMTLVDQYLSRGQHSVILDARTLPAGTYYYILETPNKRTSRRLEVIR